MILRPWTDEDTATLIGWVDVDPSLLGAMGGHTLADLIDAVAEREEQTRLGTALLAALEVDGRLAAHVVVKPLVGETGAIHFCVAPSRRGDGHALFRWTVAALATRGITHLIAEPSPAIPPAVQQRWLRRVGFVSRYYGEHHA